MQTLCSQAPGSPEFSPIRRHKFVAAGIAAILLSGVFAIYSYERDEWLRAQQAVLQYDPNAHNADEQAHRSIILDFTDSEKRRFLSMMGLGFFDKGRDQIRQQFIETLRSKLIIPKLLHVNTEAEPLGRTVYLTGLLYSTNSNKLGDMVRRDYKTGRRLPNPQSDHRVIARVV